ncbi:hypothetical protein EDC94DRAFT_646897 [Helicostylum pulchrum]|nr:hypothetical protein EDC94DRAFT_646897 [Helicostylum pulchrum]
MHRSSVLQASTLAYAQEEPTSTNRIIPTANIPVPPPGVVCPMSVCPSVSPLARREDIECPTRCAGNCKIIDDVCCPGIKKAVCNSASASASPSAVPTSPIATPSPVASKSDSGTAPPPAATKESNASILTVALSSCVLVALLTVGVYQF